MLSGYFLLLIGAVITVFVLSQKDTILQVGLIITAFGFVAGGANILEGNTEIVRPFILVGIGEIVCIAWVLLRKILAGKKFRRATDFLHG